MISSAGRLGWVMGCWLLAVGVVAGQTVRPNASLQRDTIISAEGAADTFSAQTFFDFVHQHHPIVKQANLFGEEARQSLVQARGAFDPKLVSHYDRKEFGRDLYYDHWQNKLAVPIWFSGADLTVSYDRNDPRGRYLNPEERTPQSGLTGVGLTVPIGQTMFIDARRNAVRQARLMMNAAEADRMKQVNKTLFDAAKTYWNWFLAYRQRQLVTEGYSLADQRFRALRERALLGDAAIIDTTEALITVQDRFVQRQQADVEEQNARLQVSTFLWNATGQPVELPSGVVPQEPSLALPNEEKLQTLFDLAARQHPELVKLNVKNQQLTLEERFRRALIQPQLQLNAMLLS